MSTAAHASAERLADSGPPKSSGPIARNRAAAGEYTKIDQSSQSPGTKKSTASTAGRSPIANAPVSATMNGSGGVEIGSIARQPRYLGRRRRRPKTGSYAPPHLDRFAPP